MAKIKWCSFFCPTVYISHDLVWTNIVVHYRACIAWYAETGFHAVIVTFSTRQKTACQDGESQWTGQQRFRHWSVYWSVIVWCCLKSKILTQSLILAFVKVIVSTVWRRCLHRQPGPLHANLIIYLIFFLSWRWLNTVKPAYDPHWPDGTQLAASTFNWLGHMPAVLVTGPYCCAELAIFFLDNAWKTIASTQLCLHTEGWPG